MKKLVLSLATVVATALFVNAQDSPLPAAGGAEIDFEKEVHDYGTMKQYGDASCEFTFTNTGTAPLIISNAKGSCGCTVPQWPREPIAPGASNTIKVKYDSKRVGPINKSVTITSNASSPTTVLRIKGLIEAAPKEQTSPVKKASDGAPVAN